jgi:hypothetical protein
MKDVVMEDSGFSRSLEEMRTAGQHLRSAAELFAAGVRERANAVGRVIGEILARAWDSRVVVTGRRRVESLRSLPGARPELVRISLKEQAKVIDGLAKRLSTSRDELEELSRVVTQLEERFAAVGKERAA